MFEKITTWSTVLQHINSSNLWMITLTYDEKGTSYKKKSWSSGDISVFIKRMRGYYKEDLKAYSWVMEVQESGRPHYHILILLSEGVRVRMPDKRIRYKNERGEVRYRLPMWEWGRTNIVKARSFGYLVSYVNKMSQKDYDRFPKGARQYAVWVREYELKNMLRYLSMTVAERQLADDLGMAAVTHNKVDSGWRYYSSPKDSISAILQYHEAEKLLQWMKDADEFLTNFAEDGNM